jgi:hypothetical protein
VAPAPSDLAFCDGFEEGGISTSWITKRTSSVTLAVTDANPHSGAYALHAYAPKGATGEPSHTAILERPLPPLPARCTFWVHTVGLFGDGAIRIFRVRGGAPDAGIQDYTLDIGSTDYHMAAHEHYDLVDGGSSASPGASPFDLTSLWTKVTVTLASDGGSLTIDDGEPLDLLGLPGASLTVEIGVDAVPVAVADVAYDDICCQPWP